MIAAWQVRPPRLVTIAEASFITGSQFGSVMSVTSTSPFFTLDIFEASRTMRTGPRADLLPDGAAAGQHACRRLSAGSAPRSRRRLRPANCTVSGRACST